MAGFVSKQPNGLYCRFSSVTDCPTAWNMTREDYINMKMQEAKEDAEDVLDNYLKPFGDGGGHVLSKQYDKRGI